MAHNKNHIEAVSTESLFKAFANNKSADQAVTSHNVISTFVVGCLVRIMSLVAI